MGSPATHVLPGPFVIHSEAMSNVRVHNHVPEILDRLLVMEKLLTADSSSLKTISVSLLLLSSVVSCTECNEIVQKSLTVTRQIEMYPDSTYFNDLRQLQYDGGYIYMLDMYRNNVVRLTDDFTEMDEYGISGRGPGEFASPYGFFASDDTVTVLDYADMSLKTYSSSGFISSTVSGVISGDGRFFRTFGGEYVLPMYSSDNSFVLLGGSGSRYMGEPEQYSTSRKTMTMNNSSVIPYGDCIIVVPMYQPFIKVYDRDGNVSDVLRLDKVPFYKDNISYIESRRDYKYDNVAYLMNVDACIFGSHVYVLCPRYGTHYYTDRIVSVNLSSGEVDAVFHMPDSVYSSICAVDGRFYAYNVRLGSLVELQ